MDARILLAAAALRTHLTVAGGGPGNRNDPVHDGDSDIQRHCQTQGRELADGGYRAIAEFHTQRSRAVGSSATTVADDTAGGGHGLAAQGPAGPP